MPPVSLAPEPPLSVVAPLPSLGEPPLPSLGAPPAGAVFDVVWILGQLGQRACRCHGEGGQEGVVEVRIGVSFRSGRVELTPLPVT